MGYIFCSTMFTDIEENINNTKNPMAVSGHKFEANILDGLRANGEAVTVINTPRIRFFPNYPKIFFFTNAFLWDNESVGKNIGFINLPGLNYITQAWRLYRELSKMLERLSSSSNQQVLLCFNPSLPKIIAMLAAKKKYPNTITCNVLGDLHGKNGLFVPNRAKGIRGVITKRIENAQDELSLKFDCYGFLTSYMAHALSIEDKPHVVLEGMYSADVGTMPPVNNTDEEIKTIFYAGALEDEYGIGHLLRAFSLIEDSSFRLLIAGGGSAVDAVKQHANEDHRITYLGFISPSEVERHQQEATALVNPRTSEHEFVKLSFPSKNMECLASGKPYIAHKLPCYPAEYDLHMQYPQAESDEALAAKIVEVCKLSSEERNLMGQESRAFILGQKNPKVQCEKLVKMIDALSFPTV